MRKLVFTLLMLLTLSLNAQDNVVTKFMGIPVDGSKSEMISKLKKKGFAYDSKNDCLTGEFNGSNVNIHIVTNKNKVYRIFVADSKTYSETQIKIRFNNLVYQFEHNNNYHHNSEIDQYIADDEKISYQMLVNKKNYEASFYQKGDEDIELYISSLDSAQFDNMYEQIHDAVIDMCNSIDDNYYEKEYLPDVINMSDAEIFEYDKNLLKSAVLALEIIQHFNRKVWFRIYEYYSEYYIGIYYDNGFNEPNGEDL